MAGGQKAQITTDPARQDIGRDATVTATARGVRRKKAAEQGRGRAGAWRRAKLVRKPDISQMCNKRICVRNCMSTHFKSTLSMYGHSGRGGKGREQGQESDLEADLELGGFSGALVVANATINKYEIKI